MGRLLCGSSGPSCARACTVWAMINGRQETDNGVDGCPSDPQAHQPQPSVEVEVTTPRGRISEGTAARLRSCLWSRESRSLFTPRPKPGPQPIFFAQLGSTVVQQAHCIAWTCVTASDTGVKAYAQPGQLAQAGARPESNHTSHCRMRHSSLTVAFFTDSGILH